MKTPALPRYELRKTRIVGSLSSVHAIIVDGREIHSQLSPYSEDEIEDRIRSFVNPQPVPPDSLTKYSGTTPRLKRARAVEDDAP